MASFLEVMTGYTTNVDQSIVNPKTFLAFLGVCLFETTVITYILRRPSWILRVIPCIPKIIKGMKTIRA